MSGSRIRIVVDTNVYYMNFYDDTSKAARLIRAAAEEKISLFSPDSVKAELGKLLIKDFKLGMSEAEFVIGSLPVIWIGREIYSEFMANTKIKHKADKPIEALAIALDCKIVSADRHFKKTGKVLDINQILRKVEQV